MSLVGTRPPTVDEYEQYEFVHVFDTEAPAYIRKLYIKRFLHYHLTKEEKGSVSEYMDKSRWIRSEFIRQTHHIRAVENVESLKGKIADAIGGFYAEKFIEDLAAICRCHGENLESVFQLPDARKDWLGGTANIQFLAMMLRLGDVIHFDSKRAPRSLYAEKQITDALYVYIASRDLDETDQQKLEEYKEKDPDYVRGVKEGWSILFLGECQKYVICPGIVPRAEMAQKVKEDYRKLTPDITYLYSDGTKHIMDDIISKSLME